MTTMAGLLAAGSIVVAAQGSTQTMFSGVFNDYTPASFGSWEVRGAWSLELQGNSGKGDFSAALTMLRSDYWLIANGADPDDPAARSAHTHHVAVRDGLVTAIPGGFRVTGPIVATSNGNPAFGSQSTLQIDIVGGTAVESSNIRVTFGGPAAQHFGPQPIGGVVRGAK